MNYLKKVNLIKQLITIRCSHLGKDVINQAIEMQVATNKQLLLTPEGFIVDFVQYAVKNLKANISLNQIIQMYEHDQVLAGHSHNIDDFRNILDLCESREPATIKNPNVIFEFIMYRLQISYPIYVPDIISGELVDILFDKAADELGLYTVDSDATDYSHTEGDELMDPKEEKKYQKKYKKYIEKNNETRAAYVEKNKYSFLWTWSIAAYISIYVFIFTIVHYLYSENYNMFAFIILAPTVVHLFFIYNKKSNENKVRLFEEAESKFALKSFSQFINDDQNSKINSNNYGLFFLIFTILCFVGFVIHDKNKKDGYSSVETINSSTKKSIKYSNDAEYVGQLLNGKRHGNGKVTWANGDEYSGEWQYGDREGKGEYTFQNGNKYIGEFRNNRKHGNGILYDKNGGIIYSGRWANGEYAGKY